MSTGRDDDALSWQGDDDPTLDVGSSPAEERPALPGGYQAVGRGSAEVGRIEADGTVTPAGAPAPLGNAMLITFGILGGVYLLYTIGWIIGALRLDTVAPMLIVSPAAYVPAFWLAVLAPALWFGVTLWLTRRSAAWVRIVWLIGGAVLLIPWPFIMIGAVGQ
ncbi:DNA polymerase III subunit gamma/tau [uncultured Microbacterium sp.]|uniref:DNA polymerase III, gamma/tau subunit protein n=1 Tax=uncultured Microbacterium sp. TaxID=191216 RepID=A0A1Y5P3H2_9MICO|nr:DNA polymerase III subunit gamma/tau [uncultured Microbacterium sp.]SBS70508.1 DNA polymerase III, gamma/tau subunit protein [uncultured Microbacterium sp.]